MENKNLEQIRKILVHFEKAIYSKDGECGVFDINYIEYILNEDDGFTYSLENIGLSKEQIEVRKQYKRIEMILSQIFSDIEIRD